MFGLGIVSGAIHRSPRPPFGLEKAAVSLVPPGDAATALPRNRQRFMHCEKARGTSFSGIQGKDRA